jgi:DNA-binding NtrC family response regulator
LRERCVARFDVQILDGETAGLSRLSAQVRLACQLRQPVLLVGEQGVGKETIARLIHNRSADREGPFVAIDCGRLTPGLLAETLFGDRGVAAPAAPSTVYLRTLERLPCDLQSRLCEQITSDGGGQPRYLAGCTSSPDALVKSGGLVSELYDALGVLVLEVPALRERRPDWPLLVSRLLARGAEEGGARPTSLTPAAWDVMRTHDWPGNLTELYAVLQSARRHAKGSAIDVDDLPASLRLKSRLASTPDAGAASPLSLPLDQILERTERRLIELALRRTGGHRTRAADVLGVYRYRLARRIEALGLGTPDKTDVDDADKA